MLVLFMALPMDNLEDTRFYFTEEKEIDTFMAEDASIKDSALPLQVARLRRACSALRQTALKRQTRQSISTAAEHDDLL